MKTTKELIIADITAKVEAKLASHIVELASLPRMAALKDAALKFKDKTLTANNNVKQAIVDLNNLLSQSINNFNKVVAEVDGIEEAVKELGVPLPNEAKAARDAAKAEISQQNELKKKVSSIKL
jgi:DNA anti-recombination protein RmuC